MVSYSVFVDGDYLALKKIGKNKRTAW